MDYFTFYWKHGIREVLSGETKEDALWSKYSAAAVDFISWIDEGITDSHYWNDIDKEWIQRSPLMLAPYNEVFTLPMELADKKLKGYLDKHKTVMIELDNNARLVIAHGWLPYKDKWLEVINVFYAEYDDGAYGYRYVQYFSPEHAVEAVTLFLIWAKDQYLSIAEIPNDCFRDSTGAAVTLDDLFADQHPEETKDSQADKIATEPATVAEAFVNLAEGYFEAHGEVIKTSIMDFVAERDELKDLTEVFRTRAHESIIAANLEAKIHMAKNPGKVKQFRLITISQLIAIEE